jgi:hypothetical protein
MGGIHVFYLSHYVCYISSRTQAPRLSGIHFCHQPASVSLQGDRVQAGLHMSGMFNYLGCIGPLGALYCLWL